MYTDSPNRPYVVNENDLYSCPVCNKVLGKIFNVYNDDLYTLQCPTYRNHCQRKTNIPAIMSIDYEDIKDIKFCPTCNSILKYNRELYLVCPNDESHTKPIKTNQFEINKLGYHSNY